jgi:hypothetical protein
MNISPLPKPLPDPVGDEMLLKQKMAAGLSERGAREAIARQKKRDAETAKSQPPPERP